MKTQVLNRAMRYSSNITYSNMDKEMLFAKNPLRWVMIADKEALIEKLPTLQARVATIKDGDDSADSRMAKIVLTLATNALEKYND